jgi:TolB-like protein/tetratricopeptide (TPR) repeat protein
MREMQRRGERTVYEFGEFRLDANEQLLRSRAGGVPIPLMPRAFAILRHLLEHPGQLLEKSALMSAIWPNVVVEENNLTQQISAVRRALGDGQHGQRYVLTVPGRGYRFVADVRRLETSSQPPGSNAKGRDDGAEPLAATAASVAVLPFANLSGDPTVEYFSDGMADELINMLTRVPGLAVSSRTSSFAYKGKNLHIREIARDLHVGLLLEGSVRRSAARIRVTAQLVSAETGHHVWSQTYDREFEDLFKLEDELVAAIVQSIGVATNRRLPAPLTRTPPTRDLAAYQLYLRARSQHGVPSQHNLEVAIGLYSQATALDPLFAQAYSGRASARLSMMMVGDSTWDLLATAEGEARHALGLDPGLGEATMLLGLIHSFRGRWCAGEECFRSAAAIDAGNPDMPLAHAACIAMPAGHVRKAMQEIRDAYGMAPALPSALMNLAVVHWVLALDSEAVEYADLMGDLFGVAKSIMPLAWFYSTAALRAGHFAEAARYLIDAQPAEAQTPARARAIGQVYAALADPNERAAALAELDKLQTTIGARTPDLHTRLQVAVWYTMLGALDAAYDACNAWLDQLQECGPAGPILVTLWMPDMLPFRQDPRFYALMTRLQLEQYWAAYGLPDNCELRDGKLVF